jgi:hypothetical protein
VIVRAVQAQHRNSNGLYPAIDRADGRFENKLSLTVQRISRPLEGASAAA